MLQGDSDKALKFLSVIRPEGIMNLVAIDPTTGKVTGITRPIGDDDLSTFIRAHNGKSNLYYTANEPFKNAPDAKLTKDHISKIWYLYIDADPAKGADFDTERKRLTQFSEKLNADMLYPPTLIVDSGNGHQALWKLKNPITDTEAAEAYGRGLAHKFDTDAVQNIDRLLRLPYTVNIPTKKKLELGRKPALTTVIHADRSEYIWNDLKNICQPVQAPEYESADGLDFNASILKPDLRWRDVNALEKRYYQLMEQDTTLRDFVFGDIHLPSRSEYDFMLASRLKQAGWTLEEVAIAMYLSPFGKGADLSKRDIIRAYARAENPLQEMNLGTDAEVLTAELIAALAPAVAAPLEINSDLRREFEKLGIPLPKRLHPRYGLPLSMTNPYMFKGLLDQQSLFVIYGQSNVGKSFVALDLAAHLALGLDWDGKKCKEKQAVLYVCAEAGRSFVKRIEAVKKRLGVALDADFKEFPIVVETMDVNFFESPTDKRDDAGDVIAWVKYYEAKYGIKFGMVVVDTLATSFAGGNENSSEDMTKYVSHMKRIQYGAGLSVGIVHHSGKDQAAGARGSSALRAATDTEIEVTAAQAGVKWVREIRVTKQRDGEVGEKIQFGLKTVEVGKDEDGDPIETCHVVLKSDTEFSSVIPSKTETMTTDQRAFYYAVMAAIYAGDSTRKYVNAWYIKFLENTPNTDKEVHELVENGFTPLPILTGQLGSRKNNMDKIGVKFKKEGIIELNDDNQYVIL